MINRAVLIIIFLIVNQVYSQSNKVTVSGVVVTQNGQVAEGATVVLKGTSISTMTNNKGEYLIKAVPGKYNLLVTYMGYTSNTISINLTEEGLKVKQVKLSEDTSFVGS